MKINDILSIIEKLLPKSTAIDGDRIGLQVQSGRSEISHILVTMELSDEVIDEAIDLSADCIISFHPLIYRPLTEIVEIERVGRLVTKIIKNEIAFISVHTTFDAHSEGTSKIIADLLGLCVVSFLVPTPNCANSGIGVICEARQPMNEQELVKLVSEKLFAPVKYTSGKKTENITKIGIVGGSGTSFLKDALDANLDAFITADVTYHTFHSVKGKLLLIDPGHYEMEQFVSLGIAQLIKNHSDNSVKISVSSVNTNPVSYYPDNNWKPLQNEYLRNVKINWNKQ
ncbi:MAG TPA: Nif3-like dinuclear metal center hexameric protein [Candidatus Kapabacteria bacterium]|jgi:dinuclear metal center YbgI/SA1388 family protein|nr:Nif3-like dinuclear metal center hexameric protein [Candidatus Kapabacteria bacterium]HOM04870.1 Nif3-like dinuclear metal center hexameric protein [Candidatus Kapabacteria bacterium]